MGETPPQPYVISIRRYTGLGDHLICLAAAWRFARDTGRVLVADWRFSPRSRLDPNVNVLLCTDSPGAEAAIRTRIPDLFTRQKLLRHAGEGELHLWRGAALVRDDSLVEMLLLAECDALIRYPPASFFSLSLQKPWDASDPLSPALLFSSATAPRAKP